MRFIETGPTIPDKLLLARDEGRVVFFCGAGVSRAFAKLDDFFSLASKVTSALGVSSNSAALKILNEAKTIEARTGVSGLISADRVFGLLERDFDVPAIEAAVAQALLPGQDVDLAAHKILIDLATTESRDTLAGIRTEDPLSIRSISSVSTQTWHLRLSAPMIEIHSVIFQPAHGMDSAWAK